MREDILGKMAQMSARHPGLMCAVALVITALAAGLSSRLELKMHAKNLMPQKHPMVLEFNRIIDDYRTASMIIVAAKGEETELKQFADALAPRIEAMSEYVQRVDYKIERDFFLEHGFMLQKAKDLNSSKAIFKDLGLLPWLTHVNDSFEETYVYDQESISTKEEENDAVMLLDGIKYWLTTLGAYADQGTAMRPASAQIAAERFLIGEPYFISQDKNMLLIFAQPTFTMMDVQECIDATNRIDDMIASLSKDYPAIYAGTIGSIALQRDEMEAFSQDLYLTSFIALGLILALFIASFRMWVAPLLAGISLTIGIIWTAGFTALTIGSLNLMTSMFSVILIGLGVDFSIHILSVYTENRVTGHNNADSLRNALLKSGNGIITGGFTTACAFLTLTVSENAGMKEFGIVAGCGVLFCMLSAILVLPAMLSLRDKILLKFRTKTYRMKSPEFRLLGRTATIIAKRPLRVLTGALLLTAFLLYCALQITFDYNYLNMEPAGLTSVELQQEMEEEFDVTPDFALITTSSVEEARKIAEAAKDLKMTGMVTSISEYIPSQEQQSKRAPHIREIRNSLEKNHNATPLLERQLEKFIGELYRLEDNIIELAQMAFLGGQDKVDRKCKELVGDLEDTTRQSMIAALVEKMKARPQKTVENLRIFNAQFAPPFRQLALGMASIDPVTVETLPKTILNEFVSKNSDKYLVSIYPKEQVWNLEFLERFTNQMQNLDPRVTGIPPIVYVLIDLIAKDGKIAATLTVIVVFLLLLWDFKSPRTALVAMVPLLIGAIWMLGVMQLMGLQLTLLNVIGLPLILGIGIDDGVHLLHRYRVEGRGKIGEVFTSTGKAVLLTSVTTMLAFGSLLFATYRGLGSLGIALFIGVGTCFLTSIIVLPALLGWFEKRGG